MSIRTLLSLSLAIGGLVACTSSTEADPSDEGPTAESETALGGTSVARRCFAAGLTAPRCRAILNDHRDDGVTIAQRCRSAGLTVTQCRRLVADDADREDTPTRGDGR